MRPRLSFMSFLLVTVWWPISSSFAGPVPADHQCMGRWVGEGRNTGHPTPWTIDLTLTASPNGGRCGSIEYTNPDCGGTLENCRLVGSDIHTEERYTHRSADCAPAGQVIIRCEGDQMRYSWIGWERVDSILRRPEGARTDPVQTPAPSRPSSAPSSPSPQSDEPHVPRNPDSTQGSTPGMSRRPATQPPPAPPVPANRSWFSCGISAADTSPSLPLLVWGSVFLLSSRRYRRR